MAERTTAEWKALTSIAVPLVIVQVGMMLMGVVDTLIIGRVSPDALAAVALGNLYFFNCIVIPMGTLMALDPLVAQGVGAKDDLAVARAVQRGLLLALILGVLATLAMLPAGPFLRFFRQPVQVIPDATAYIHISAWTMIPFLMFVVIRQTMQALHRIAPIVWTIVIGNVINAVLNWVLIFGHWGAKPMGVAGSAIATLIARWAMFLLLFVVAWKDMRPFMRTLDRSSFTWQPMWRMLALGLPIGFQQALEFGAFAAVGLLMGTFGAVQVAAHQVALNLAALTFMVPLGVGAAAAVRVGHAVGAGDQARAQHAARLSYVVGAAFMMSTAVLFLLFPEELASMYSSDSTLIAVAGVLIPIAGVFQVFDGMQAVGAGVLRGLGDTRVPLIAMLLGYWLIGVPISLHLAFRTGIGPQGLWWGFVAGLAAVALFLLWRVQTLFRRGVNRVHVDIPSIA
jgi:MATE family multidrug resistance protein